MVVIPMTVNQLVCKFIANFVTNIDLCKHFCQKNYAI